MSINIVGDHLACDVPLGVPSSEIPSTRTGTGSRVRQKQIGGKKQKELTEEQKQEIKEADELLALLCGYRRLGKISLIFPFLDWE